MPSTSKKKRRTAYSAKQLIALSVLTVITFAVTALALNYDRVSPPPTEAAAKYLASPPVVEEPISFVAIGDSFTGGSRAGGSRGTPTNWVAVAEKQLNDEGFNVRSVEAGIGGSGYLYEGPAEMIFEDRIPELLGEGSEVVLFFGSINDRSLPISEVSVKQAETLREAHEAAPNAKFIIVGPAWLTPDVPADVYAMRDSLAALAEKHGATWIDPLAEEWFFDRPDLTGIDGSHPSEEGHAYMAEKMLPAIREAVKHFDSQG